MMTNEIFTMNNKHTQSEKELNRLQTQANHGSNLLESLINLSVSVTILLFTVKFKYFFSIQQDP